MYALGLASAAPMGDRTQDVGWVRNAEWSEECVS